MSESKYFIQGSGGGGKAGGSSSVSPTTDDDDLASKQFAKVLDLLSEGPIEAIEEIRLNNTQITHFKGYEQHHRS